MPYLISLARNKNCEYTSKYKLKWLNRLPVQLHFIMLTRTQYSSMHFIINDFKFLPACVLIARCACALIRSTQNKFVTTLIKVYCKKKAHSTLSIWVANFVSNNSSNLIKIISNETIVISFFFCCCSWLNEAQVLANRI